MRAVKEQRHAERREDDAYETPQQLADEICRRLEVVLPSPLWVVEPSAGGGNFVAAARKAWPDARIVAIDVRPECEETCRARGADEFYCGPFEDFARRNAKESRHFDMVVGNPPFSLAQAHTELAMKLLYSNGHLAFLLKTGFACSVKRARTLWQEFPLKHYWPIAERPSYTGDGKTEPRTEYAVFGWQRGHEGSGIWHPHIFWKGEED